MLRSLCIVSVLFTASLAHAEGEELEPRKPLTASVTFSPIHLVIPAAEVTVEVKAAPKIGIAVIGAVGSVKALTSDQRVTVFEAGISPRYYVVGDFRQGVQLGVEALYAHASAESNEVMLKAEGLSIGPYVGYKWVASFGLTLEAQLGASYFAMRGDGVDEDDSKFAVLLNLQIGWSF